MTSEDREKAPEQTLETVCGDRVFGNTLLKQGVNEKCGQGVNGERHGQPYLLVLTGLLLSVLPVAASVLLWIGSHQSIELS
jgi:hypothetical protein